ncbi:MAG TPA: branched-chain amino acid ABC transporter permease [Xanthobacteraceae bacterium]|nr:branched-chain amino acid ABC transporter permease [Xanthobacteraceae bacterium]
MATTSAGPVRSQTGLAGLLSGKVRVPPIVAYAVGLAVLVVAPFLAYPLFLAKILCFCLFACAFNLLGSVGLLSFGHAAFFGASAYVAGHALKVWGLPFELAALIGTAAATVLGVVFGFVAIRRQGLYFAMITLALAQMIYFLALQVPFTHAEDGLTGVPRGYILGLFNLNNLYVLYYTAAVIFLVGYFLIYRITRSTFGQILKAIREKEPRAISLGYRVNDYKLLVFVLSAALAGLAGATKTMVVQLASLTDVHWSTSGDVILMTLLGGSGTLFGPVVGAVLVEMLQFYLADSGLPIQAVIGAIFIVCILLFRRGIVGEISQMLGAKRDTPAS